jgi:hypothetical protein
LTSFNLATRLQRSIWRRRRKKKKKKTFQTSLDAEGSPISFLLATRLKRGMIEEEQEEEEKEDKSKEEEEKNYEGV